MRWWGLARRSPRAGIVYRLVMGMGARAGWSSSPRDRQVNRWRSLTAVGWSLVAMAAWFTLLNVRERGVEGKRRLANDDGAHLIVRGPPRENGQRTPSL